MMSVAFGSNTTNRVAFFGILPQDLGRQTLWARRTTSGWAWCTLLPASNPSKADSTTAQGCFALKSSTRKRFDCSLSLTMRILRLPFSRNLEAMPSRTANYRTASIENSQCPPAVVLASSLPFCAH